MMMQTLIFLFLALVPLAGFASITGTAHDMELGAMGSCSVCHLPHQGEGEKLWSKELVTEGKVGTVSAMCGSCHHSGGGYGALMTRAHSDDYVFGANSHGQKMGLANPPPGTDALASGLPKIDTAHGNFECTTCHNVHDDTYRPFLRDAPNALCARCHKLRHFVNGADKSGPAVETGLWGVPARLGLPNPGSHPVGEDVVEGRQEVSSPTRPAAVTDRSKRLPAIPPVKIPSLFKAPFSAEPGKWSLGGHLSRGREGGVTCLTCHAVHGSDPDPDDVSAFGTSAAPQAAFLVVRQSEGAAPGYSRTVANGAGDTSALCEACHGVGNNPKQSPSGDTWSDPRHNVNPGPVGTFSHPVDTYPSSSDARVTQFPDGWPRGASALAGANVSPVPVCESCHTPHAAAALAAARSDVRLGAGGYLLRAPLAAGSQQPLCDSCHALAVANHHPIGKKYDSSGVPYLLNSRAGPDDVLTCSTCHTSAHGWSAPSAAGLDPKWLPADNGRSNLQLADMYNPDMSKTCMDCHYFMDGDGASVNPTLGTKQTVIATSDDEYIHYQARDRGKATHYIGLIHEGKSWQFNPLVNIFETTRSWKEQSPDPRYTGGLAPGWARFGGEDKDGSRVLVCESCHELEPDRNAGFRHLLLAPYEEGQNGIDEYSGDVDGRDILCEVCHGVPKNTHPMSGMIVSRTEKPLDANALWLRPTILGHATLDRALNALSCDSCHQPHDANQNSSTYIIDCPDVGPIANYTVPPVDVGIPDLTNPSELKVFGYTVAGAGDRATYATPTLVSSPHSGLCFQCHNQ